MNVVLKENVIYGSVLGAGLVADIAYPEDRDNLTALISVHGGRWIRGTRHDDGREGRADNGVVQILEWADAGYFVMRIDYRLVTCTPAPACFQDVMCSLRWLHAHTKDFGVDPSRIFLMGQSAGGHMAALAATLGPGAFPPCGGWEAHSSDFAAAISVAGAYDLCSLDWGSGWCPPGQPWDEARRFASPQSHVSTKTKPILLFHAADDHSVPIAQADTFSQKLAQAGAQHRYHRYDTGGI